MRTRTLIAGLTLVWVAMTCASCGDGPPVAEPSNMEDLTTSVREYVLAPHAERMLILANSTPDEQLDFCIASAKYPTPYILLDDMLLIPYARDLAPVIAERLGDPATDVLDADLLFEVLQTLASFSDYDFLNDTELVAVAKGAAIRLSSNEEGLDFRKSYEAFVRAALNQKSSGRER